ncbi:MAG: SBBP repeat-containing protein [Candidatus Latescibacteria bacterium]|nr:SBBP repeat-containing protein [Candidatus Latescibacterota bacterium]
MSKSNKLLFVICAGCLVCANVLFAQVDTAWVRRYNGPGNSADTARAIAVDDSGNIYVAGASTGSGTNLDCTTVKYNADGDIVWESRYNGAGNSADGANAIAIDGAGNIYVSGYSTGAGSGADFVTIKYNSNGETLWVRSYNGPGNSTDNARAIALDSSGNVYVTGYSRSTSASGSEDYATIKYNSAGVQQWVARYNGPGNSHDGAAAIALDAQGNVYVTGESYSTSTLTDHATIKYNSAGDTLWVRRYNGPGNEYDWANAIALDAQGNVYVTGKCNAGPPTYNDYATIKYNSAGVEQWVQRYNGPGNSTDEACAIAVDGQNNVYVTGTSWGSGTSIDYATIKYNSAGDTLWVRRYNGPGNVGDNAYAIALDAQGNVYVTGQSRTGSLLYTSDYATIKYNSAGVEQWVQRYNGPGNYGDRGQAVAVDNSGNVYVAGFSTGSGTSIDYATIKYVQASGINELMGSGNGELRVSVYPNPARNYFTIRFSQTADHIQIYDISGKLVREILRSAQHDNMTRVSLDGIKNGVYFVSVTTNNQRYIERIVITK